MSRMYVKRWVAFAALLVAACLPAYGNSSASVPQDLLTRPGDTVIGSAPALHLEGCVLFRSTLHDTRRNSTGMRVERTPTGVPPLRRSHLDHPLLTLGRSQTSHLIESLVAAQSGRAKYTQFRSPSPGASFGHGSAGWPTRLRRHLCESRSAG